MKLCAHRICTGAQLGNFNGKGCMVEMGHKDTGFPIETLLGHRMIRVHLYAFKGKGCMVEMGLNKDTGLPIETLGPSHHTSTFLSFNNLIAWPDTNRAKLPSLLRSAGVEVESPTTPL